MTHSRVLHLRVMSIGNRWLANKVFDRFPITIGRAPQSDLYVDCGHISRAHAFIEQKDDVLLITDVGSCNGTFVNGSRIAAHTPIELAGWHVAFLIGPLWVQGWHEAPPVDPHADRPSIPLFDEARAR
jgi:predicted component of type VI protein secretion system